VALHGGDPGGRGRCRTGRSCLVQRGHVAVELGGVVGYLHPDVPGIDLCLALKASSITVWTAPGSPEA
jgi:hypothetical protein